MNYLWLAILAACITASLIVFKLSGRINNQSMRYICLAAVGFTALALGARLSIPTFTNISFVCDQSWASCSGAAAMYCQELPGLVSNRKIYTTIRTDQGSTRYVPNLQDGLDRAVRELYSPHGFWDSLKGLLPVKRRIVVFYGNEASESDLNAVYPIISKCADGGIHVDAVSLTGDALNRSISLSVPGGRFPSQIVYKGSPATLFRANIPRDLTPKWPLQVIIEMSIPGFGKLQVKGNLPESSVNKKMSNSQFVQIDISRGWFSESVAKSANRNPDFDHNEYQGIGEIRLSLIEDGSKAISRPFPVIFDPVVLVSKPDPAQQIKPGIYGFFYSSSPADRANIQGLVITSSSLDYPAVEDFAQFAARGGLLILCSWESLLGREIKYSNTNNFNEWLFNLDSPSLYTIRGNLWDSIGSWYSWSTNQLANKENDTFDRQGGLDIDLDTHSDYPYLLVDRTLWTGLMGSIVASGECVPTLSYSQQPASLEERIPAINYNETTNRWLSTTWQPGRQIEWVTDGQIPDDLGMGMALRNDAGRTLALAQSVFVTFRHSGMDVADPVISFRKQLGFSDSNVSTGLPQQAYHFQHFDSELKISSPFSFNGPSDISQSIGPRRFSVIAGDTNSTPFAWVQLSPDEFNAPLPVGVVGYYGKGIIADFGFVPNPQASGQEEKNLLSLFAGLEMRGHLAVAPLSTNGIVLRGVKENSDGANLVLSICNYSSNSQPFRVDISSEHVRDYPPMFFDQNKDIEVPRSACHGQSNSIDIVLQTGTESLPVMLLDISDSSENFALSLHELTFQTGGMDNLSPASKTTKNYLASIGSGVHLNSNEGAVLGLFAGICWYWPAFVKRFRSIKLKKRQEQFSMGNFENMSQTIDLNSRNAISGVVGEYLRRRHIEVGDPTSTIDRINLAVQSIAKVNLLPKVRIFRREMKSPIQIVVDNTSRLVGSVLPRTRSSTFVNNVSKLVKLFAHHAANNRTPAVITSVTGKVHLSCQPEPTINDIAKWLKAQPSANRRSLEEIEPISAGARIIIIGSFGPRDVASLTRLDQILQETGGGIGVVHVVVGADIAATGNLLETGLAGWTDRSLVRPDETDRRVGAVDIWREKQLSTCAFESVVVNIEASEIELMMSLREKPLMEAFL